MRTEVIEADTIDVAVEGILDELHRSGQNVIYFDGWDGLGASAVLRAVAQRLALKEQTRPPGLNFENVIHIDCSKWVSTRAVQRKIAEQLKLPNWVMDIFDKQDDEDDFSGITDQGSRTEIAEVAVEIQRSTQGGRFLLVLHNGSNKEIDIPSLGLSIYGYLTNKVVWTFQGRFRIDSNMRDKVMNNTTYVLLSASCSKRDPHELWSYLLHEEAAQVVCKHGIDPAIAVECFLYMLTLNCIRGHHVDTEYDLATHTCNYWICDGIIQVTNIAEAWQVSGALEGEMRMDIDYCHSELPSHLVRHDESIPHWSSPAKGFVVVPAGVIPNGMFQHFDKLGVLKLFKCTFNFSSPPFLFCHILRFLWLEHCQDLRSTVAEQREEKEDTTRSWACFHSLWVLDLRYTDCDQILSARMMDRMTNLRELNVMGAKNWDMNHLRGRLSSIHKLRVRKSSCCFNNNVFSEMDSLVLLDFSGNTIRQGMKSLSGPASNNSLKTVIIDGCDDLETISLRGSKQLKNLILKGSVRDLEELDLSGTRVENLDLREVVVTSAIQLHFRLSRDSSLPKRIILLGCEMLHAILWPHNLEDEQWPDVLRIDTTSTTSPAGGAEAPHAHPHGDRSLQQQKEEMFIGGWSISITDARLLRSLYPVRDYFMFASLHIDILSAATIGRSNIQETSSDKLVPVQPHTSTLVDSMYIDVLKDGPAAKIMMWDCPKILLRSNRHSATCIIKVIMHGRDKELLEDSPSASSLLWPDFIYQEVTSLHVYDTSSTNSIPAPPQGSGWKNLRWCRVERCPKLHTVFNMSQGSDRSSFFYLETFWASQLLTACYIWDWRSTAIYHTFSHLKFLHLDYCPMILHVVPIHVGALSELESLEIVYCADLREVFPLNHEHQEQDAIIEFPKLRCIHLHKLPMLQCICGLRMSAPNLETIKIRSCSSLMRLPALGSNTKPPKVDCEKEWWDNLEWDGLKENHHPSLYETSHSVYYKAPYSGNPSFQ